MHFLAIVLGTILGNLLYQWIKSKRGYKYKWTCPNCDNFSASSNNMNVLQLAESIHRCENGTEPGPTGD